MYNKIWVFFDAIKVDSQGSRTNFLNAPYSVCLRNIAYWILIAVTINIFDTYRWKIERFLPRSYTAIKLRGNKNEENFNNQPSQPNSEMERGIRKLVETWLRNWQCFNPPHRWQVSSTFFENMNEKPKYLEYNFCLEMTNSFLAICSFL